MKENDYVYHMHPVHEFGNVETSKLLIARLTEDMPVGGQLTPDIKNQIKIAVKICGDCPVKSQCLDQGLERENLIIGSIWGGLVFRERQYLAKRRKASKLN